MTMNIMHTHTHTHIY